MILRGRVEILEGCVCEAGVCVCVCVLSGLRREREERAGEGGCNERGRVEIRVKIFWVKVRELGACYNAKEW